MYLDLRTSVPILHYLTFFSEHSTILKQIFQIWRHRNVRFNGQKILYYTTMIMSSQSWFFRCIHIFIECCIQWCFYYKGLFPFYSRWRADGRQGDCPSHNHRVRVMVFMGECGSYLLCSCHKYCHRGCWWHHANNLTDNNSK